MSLNPFTRRQLETDCTVEVSHTFDSLHAHVTLDPTPDGEIAIQPGDTVLVHGAPVQAPYGAIVTERRRATISKAGWIERQWTRATGDLEFLELCEFSFSEAPRL